MSPPARERDGITAEPLVRLGALSPPGSAATRSPSYEERAGALIRRSAPPEGLAAGELEHVWRRLAGARRSRARRVLGPWTWTRWTLAMAVLGVSGAAVAAVTGAWTWPRVAWHQIDGSQSSPSSRGPASSAPRARPRAATGRGLAPSRPASTADLPAGPALAMAEAPVPPAPVPQVIVQAGSRAASSPPVPPRPATATRRAGSLGATSHSSPAAPPISPSSIAPLGDPSSAPAPLTPGPFATPSPAASPDALAAARPVDRALAEEGELLGRAVARLRQAHDPAGALAELDRYAARFPSGVLHREAQAARVDALLLARRPADARFVLEQLTLGGDARDRELRLIRAELAAESAPARALEDFRAVWTAHPSGPTGERSLWGMAACHARLADEPRTRAALELYLARFPDGPHAAAAAARAARRD